MGTIEASAAWVPPKPRRPQQQATQRKRRWTREEDMTLLQRVETYGTSSWVTIAKGIPDRTAKQCRERWSNNLRPGVNQSWTEGEDLMLLEYIAKNGRDWKSLVQLLGKTANALKNRYFSLLRKMENRKTEALPLSKKLKAALEKSEETEDTEEQEPTFPLSIEALLNRPVARTP